MPGQLFTPVGEYVRQIAHNISAMHNVITDVMCAEHDWLTVGTASHKFAFDKILENFVEIYIKILNFGKLLKNYVI